MSNESAINVSDDLIQALEQELNEIEKNITDSSVKQFQSPDIYEARFKGYSLCVFCVEQWTKLDGHLSAVEKVLYDELVALKSQIVSSSPAVISNFEIRDEEMLGVEVGFALCLDLIKLRSSGGDPSATIETLLWKCDDEEDEDYYPVTTYSSQISVLDEAIGPIKICSMDSPAKVTDSTRQNASVKPYPLSRNMGNAPHARDGLMIRAIAAGPFLVPLFFYVGSFGGMLIRYWAWLIVVFAVGVYCSDREYRPVVGWVVPFVILGIVFNPAVPFYFDRSTWLVLDIVFAILIFVCPTKKSGVSTSIRNKPTA